MVLVIRLGMVCLDRDENVRNERRVAVVVATGLLVKNATQRALE